MHILGNLAMKIMVTENISVNIIMNGLAIERWKISNS